jgi:hypothetical protein
MDDELKGRLAKACAGLSTAEIADALMASKHGAALSDPLSVAAYLKKIAS